MRHDNRRTWLAAGAAAVAAASTAITTTHWFGSPRGAPVRAVPTLRSARKAGARALNVLLVVTRRERLDLPPGLPLPAHERLREQGVAFTQWHAPTTGGAAARAALYFGQHVQRTRLVTEPERWPEPQLPPDLPSLGDLFRANGYRTAFKGCWGMGGAQPVPGMPARDALEAFGFSDFNLEGERRGGPWAGYTGDAATAAEAAQWLLGTARGSREPWLLAVNFVNPQDVAYLAVSEAQRRSQRLPDRPVTLALAPADPLYAHDWALPLPANHADDLGRKPWAQRQFRSWCEQAFGRVDDGDGHGWRAYQNAYFNAIRDADRRLQVVLDALEASGQADRTVVVFTSDRGELAGAHGLRQDGPFVYQEALRVPCIVRHPDVRGARQTAALGCAIDLVPTLLELAGCDPALVADAYAQLPGVSLAAAVARPEARTARDQRGILLQHCTPELGDAQHAAQLLAHGIVEDRFRPLRALAAGLRPTPVQPQPTQIRALHTGRYKLARYFRASDHHKPADWETLARHNTLELYDLQADAGELDNLAHAPEWARTRVLELNAQLNALVALEIGEDLGDVLPGPSFRKRL